MGKALYRKYRSKNLSEVIGQAHITDGLTRALQTGKISHAYLFTGPRGVGKTSVARILAHEINKLPYESDDDTHLDIIEIDAASNRRIDEIRELRQRAHIAPTSAKYKVYIIDEVHMLTKEAFNALLKTLEEPPEHVVFILATTEMHKLPETIVSRTQRFGFKPIEKSFVIEHLAKIAKQEKLNVDKEALELIAEHGDGSFRDSISLLDQVQHIEDNISYDHVASSLGLAPSEIIQSLADSIGAKNTVQTNDILQNAKSIGVQPLQLSKQLSQLLLSNLLIDETHNTNENLLLIDKLARLPQHPDPQLGLELSIFESVLAGSLTTKEQIPHKTVKSNKNEEAEQSVITHDSVKIEAKPAPEALKLEKLPATAKNVEQEWVNVLETLKTRYNTLYGVIRMAKPMFEDGAIILEFSFPFHQKKLAESKNQKLLSDIVYELTATKVTIKATHSATKAKERYASKKTIETADLTTISNIFGDAELVE